jgi:hypothetical protein
MQLNNLEKRTLFVQQELAAWDEATSSSPAYQYYLQFSHIHTSYAKLLAVQSIDRLRWKYPFSYSDLHHTSPVVDDSVACLEF